VSREVVGILRGEYGVSGSGLMLFDRRGACISINLPSEDSAFEEANNRDLRENRSALYGEWENVPLIHNAAIFSNLYHQNYYHFTYEVAQKFRLLRYLDVNTVILPDQVLGAEFQRDLLSRAMGERKLLSTRHALRVRDPVIIQTYQCTEALLWLRSLYGTNAAPDGRKYYVRRTPVKTRSGNNISETRDFLEMLEKHNFLIVDFGNGESSIQDQIRMMDGASLILTAHGAGLTNLTYLRAPLRVVEVFGPAVLSTSFMRISTALGFDHHAIISTDLDHAGDVVVDRGTIEPLLIS
jgi:capsular polysaccharide biosynthesis protein